MEAGRDTGDRSKDNVSVTNAYGMRENGASDNADTNEKYFFLLKINAKRLRIKGFQKNGKVLSTVNENCYFLNAYLCFGE